MWGSLSRGPPATVPGARGSNGFKSDSKFKWFKNRFKFFQTLTDPKELPELKKIEIKYSFEGFE
jgi:hypothetical protein